MEYQLRDADLIVTISDIGAEMQSIKYKGQEYLWNGDETYWAERSPILFPYVGRFTEGKYTLGGQVYEMDIHGFARRLRYHVKEQNPQKIVFALYDTEKTRRSYPFSFALEIGCALKNGEIEISYHVENQSSDTMYFGIGGHPGFALPLEEGLEFSDYYLEFETKCCPDRIGHTETCFLSGENKPFELQDGRRLPLCHELFDDDAIVLQNMAGQVTIKTDKGQRKVKVSYPQMPYLGLWHAPKTQAPYLCVEPWTSLPSRQDVVEEFQCKSDLIRLEPGSIYTNFWHITIK